ncbi:MAG: SDR family oxidoreductase [Cyanobacteria bacterium J06636_16]
MPSCTTPLAVGAEQALEEIIQAGGSGVVLQADLREDHAAENLANAVIEALVGRQLDLCVINAEIAAASPLGHSDPADIWAMTMVNLLAPFELINRLAPHIAPEGSVITLSVAATHRVFSPDFAYFSATKAAMDCLVRHWAVALGNRGVRVNAIAPGVIEANFRAQLLQNPTFRAELESATALGRAGQIADVVDAVAFLASLEARWITGQVIDVSGCSTRLKPPSARNINHLSGNPTS